MRVVVYVLAYDAASEAEARARFGSCEWARVVRLPDESPHTKYMEGAAFLSVLPARRDEWKDADFVGTLSWKAHQKIGVPDFAELCAEVRHADVVALLPSTEHALMQAVRCHPRFLEVWVPLLQKMGYAAKDVVSIRLPSMYCNYWLAKPAWMDRFLSFYARAVHLLETDEELQEPVWDSACYNTALPPERVRQIYGKAHVTYHPFVGERLISAFCHLEHAALAMVPLGLGEFWKRHYDAEIADVAARARHMADTMGFRT